MQPELSWTVSQSNSNSGSVCDCPLLRAKCCLECFQISHQSDVLNITFAIFINLETEASVSSPNSTKGILSLKCKTRF